MNDNESTLVDALTMLVSSVYYYLNMEDEVRGCHDITTLSTMRVRFPNTYIDPQLFIDEHIAEIQNCLLADPRLELKNVILDAMYRLGIKDDKLNEPYDDRAEYDDDRE
jgi:hypothetical protein